MALRIHAADLHLTNLRTRMPFKYGIATMTHMPMAFVRLQIEIDGTSSTGIASDLLPPKWFTKDPSRPADDEIHEMFDVIQSAARLSIGREGESAFALWREFYDLRSELGHSRNRPPLLNHFGTSLVERALIEAVCRARNECFSAALRNNSLGIDLGRIHPELDGLSPGGLLADEPVSECIVRHTVGLADPLTADDIPKESRLDDGLPQALSDCISGYGLRHFKIKVNGQPENDLPRLKQIAGLLARQAPANYAFSLDGNEQFKSFAAFRSFWEVLRRDSGLEAFLDRLLFIEQPLHRDVALQPAAAAALDDWNDRPPIIIDESDGDLDSLPTALNLGYAGTSHKNCKGVFKGIANRCLLLHRARGNPEGSWMMSGEDLCNIGPVALLQDLAVSAALGIESIERNGHHYCAGLSQFPESIQQAVLEHHGDLYHPSEAGWPTLTVKEGTANLSSVIQAPLGVGFEVPVEVFTPAADWRPEVLS